MFENHPGFEEAPILRISEKPEWITGNSISVEACLGDGKCPPMERSVLGCRVERKCSLNQSSRRLPVSPM